MRISDWSSDVCSSDLQLAAAVLVEEDDARIELARLREQEIERHGLSRTRRADDREIAEITLVKVEEIRHCRGRLEQGDRIAPMIALALAKCELMQIGRAHVCTPVTNAHLVCRLLLEKQKKQS